MVILDEFLKAALKYVAMIQIKDIIDILLVACIFFWLFNVLRNSSALRIMRSVLLILLILGLATVLQLQVLSFLLQSTFQVGLIAVIILFQPELRRVLEQLGATKVFRFFETKSETTGMENAIEQTVEACKALSWAREGALIVFERKVKLQEIVLSGTVLDSSVAGELLKNIFYPKAPLHDGAVIVRDDRIVGAGCVLPLTGNKNLSKELGMRHRAGIGMSENSDAVVIIVSEESGSISVATDGMLKRHLMPDTLEKLMRSLLLPQTKASTGFWGKLFRSKGKADKRR
jgi:diadenylate cyclase